MDYSLVGCGEMRQQCLKLKDRANWDSEFAWDFNRLSKWVLYQIANGRFPPKIRSL